MNKKLITAAYVAVLLAMPVASLAFSSGNQPNAVNNIGVNDLIDVVFSIIWPVAVAFFVIMFLMAAFSFFTAKGDPAGIEKARQEVIWGVVGVVVALLAFSIPFIVRTTLNQGI